MAATPLEPEASLHGPMAERGRLEARRCEADYKSMVVEGVSPVDSDEDVNAGVDENEDKGELNESEAEEERLLQEAEAARQQTVLRVDSEEPPAPTAVDEAFEATFLL